MKKILLLGIIISSSLFANSIGNITVQQNFLCNNEIGVKFTIGQVSINGYKGKKVHFGMNVRQGTKWLNIWYAFSAELVKYDPVYWNSGGWFCYTYTTLRKKGNDTLPYTGVFTIMDTTANKVILDKDVVFSLPVAIDPKTLFGYQMCITHCMKSSITDTQERQCTTLCRSK